MMMTRYRSEVQRQAEVRQRPGARSAPRTAATTAWSRRPAAALAARPTTRSSSTRPARRSDWAFISAAKPTLTASSHPQFVYLSNAGDSTSVVLNALRARKDDDPSLAYLEWSAAPNRKADDLTGWLESNPATGHLPHVLHTLEREYRTNLLAGTMAIFETEHLCRWVTSTQAAFVDEAVWLDAKADLGIARRPMMAVGMDRRHPRLGGHRLAARQRRGRRPGRRRRDRPPDRHRPLRLGPA